MVKGKKIRCTCKIGTGCHTRADERVFILSNKNFHDNVSNQEEIVGITNDVTKFEAIQQELQTSQERFKALVNSMQDMVFTLDITGSCTGFYGHWASKIGILDVIADNKLARILESSYVEFEHFIIPKVLQGESILYDCIFSLPIGRRDIQLSLSPMYDEYGEIKGIVAVGRDITEHKNLGKILQMQNDELQSMLSQLKNAQMKLIQQEKLAGIGQLAAGVAHEINNPLGFVTSNFTSLKNYVERMQSTIIEYQKLKKILVNVDDNILQEYIVKISTMEREKKIDFVLEDIKELFKESNDGLERVAKIVAGLRSFARIDHDLNFQEYNLNDNIKDTIIIAKNEIKYWANIEENLTDIPLIEVVGGYINQVLLNIIVNAAQAIKQKKMDIPGLLKISTYGDENNVYCEITDNGVGISDENKQKVFDAFFTTKPVGQGTGLGLSISHDIIVNKHAGELTLNSAVGKGTTFIIKLPIKQKI